MEVISHFKRVVSREDVPYSRNPFTPNKISYLRFLDRSISNRRGVWLVLFLPYFIEIPVFNANSLDPDQMSQNAASDLGLDCSQCPIYGTPGINGLSMNSLCKKKKKKKKKKVTAK